MEGRTDRSGPGAIIAITTHGKSFIGTRKETTMLAIPVLRSRVAPVLNWCSRVLIISEDAPGLPEGQEIEVGSLDPFELLRVLKAKGITTLICGALTPDLLRYGEYLGLRVFCGIAGDLDEVLSANREKRLDDPRFRLPGCKNVCLCGQANQGRWANKSGRTQPPGANESTCGMSGVCTPVCTCPACGREIPHRRGVPCSLERCPDCGVPMVQKE
jgi:hypothetical protein